jgi:prepilin peptidase CpaA
MDYWTAPNHVFVAAIVLLTGIAAYTDIRSGRIFNWLTLPFFGMGWVYQFWAFGVGEPGLLDGLKGFALGFLTFFALMAIGGGGGGDVKLMGALSVWMGFRLTLYVLILSTILVALDLLIAMARTIIRTGIRGFKKEYFPDGKADPGGRPETDDAKPPLRRRTMRFAVPLALAAWLVLMADGSVLKGYHLPP